MMNKKSQQRYLIMISYFSVKQTMQESTAFGAAVAAALADGINVWTVSDLKIDCENFSPQMPESG